MIFSKHYQVIIQRVEKFSPAINKVYFIESHTLFHILSGKGSIQVDFKNYFDWQEKAIFLEKGQYIKYLSDDFIVRRIEFSNENKFYSNDVSVGGGYKKEKATG